MENEGSEADRVKALVKGLTEGQRQALWTLASWCVPRGSGRMVLSHRWAHHRVANNLAGKRLVSWIGLGYGSGRKEYRYGLTSLGWMVIEAMRGEREA